MVLEAPVLGYTETKMGKSKETHCTVYATVFNFLNAVLTSLLCTLHVVESSGGGGQTTTVQQHWDCNISWSKYGTVIKMVDCIVNLVPVASYSKVD